MTHSLRTWWCRPNLPRGHLVPSAVFLGRWPLQVHVVHDLLLGLEYKPCEDTGLVLGPGACLVFAGGRGWGGEAVAPVRLRETKSWGTGTERGAAGDEGRSPRCQCCCLQARQARGQAPDSAGTTTPR